MSIQSALFKRAFSNDAIMKPIKEAAKEAAKEFVVSDFQQFFTRWSDQIYEHGMKISDKTELLTFANKMKGEIEVLRRQAQIQGVYEIIPLSH